MPGRRIVYSYRMQISDWLISVSLATIEIEPDGNGTKLTFTEHATFLNGFEDCNAEGRKSETEGLLNQMEASLAE